jgi:hypothetical protein
MVTMGETRSQPTRKRAVRLLHSLFVAVEEHGHEVRLSDRSGSPSCERGRRALEIVIDASAMEVSLREHLARQVHERTALEEKWTTLARRYDLEPSGDLILELSVPWGTRARTRWRDGEKARLEDLLGEVVGAVHQAAEDLVVHRAQVAEEARRAEVARSLAEEAERKRQHLAEEVRERRQREERFATHRAWLADDLMAMATSWRAAEMLQAFLGALDAKVPSHDRPENFAAWFEWAKEYATRLDPLKDPQALAKVLEPDLTNPTLATPERHP